MEKNELPFEILSDQGAVVAKDYRITYTLSTQIQQLYDKFGLNIPEANGDTSYVLPVPATYIIGADGVVRYAFLEINHTMRMEPNEILDQLRAMR